MDDSIQRPALSLGNAGRPACLSGPEMYARSTRLNVTTPVTGDRTRRASSGVQMKQVLTRVVVRKTKIQQDIYFIGLSTRWGSKYMSQGPFPGSFSRIGGYQCIPGASRPYTCSASPIAKRVQEKKSFKNAPKPSQLVTLDASSEPSSAATLNGLNSTALDVPLDSELVGPSVQSPAKPSKPALPKFWSHRLHKAEDGKDIIVYHCRSLKSAERVAQHFLHDKILGFDMEWKAQASRPDSIKDNVSLLQLANSNRIALFHLSRFNPAKTLSHFIVPSLKRIMESPDITKAGVSIKADCTRLRKYLGIDARGIFELSHLHKLVKHSRSSPNLINKKLVRLDEQVEEHFGLPLEKDGSVRCSNWASPLNYRQVQYAAADVYACYRLFDTMDAKRRALDPSPPLPAHAELNLPIRIVQETPSKEVEVLETEAEPEPEPESSSEEPRKIAQVSEQLSVG